MRSCSSALKSHQNVHIGAHTVFWIWSAGSDLIPGFTKQFILVLEPSVEHISGEMNSLLQPGHGDSYLPSQQGHVHMAASQLLLMDSECQENLASNELSN